MEKKKRWTSPPGSYKRNSGHGHGHSHGHGRSSPPRFNRHSSSSRSSSRQRSPPPSDRHYKSGSSNGHGGGHNNNYRRHNSLDGKSSSSSSTRRSSPPPPPPPSSRDYYKNNKDNRSRSNSQNHSNHNGNHSHHRNKSYEDDRKRSGSSSSRLPERGSSCSNSSSSRPFNSSSPPKPSQSQYHRSRSNFHRSNGNASAGAGSGSRSSDGKSSERHHRRNGSPAVQSSPPRSSSRPVNNNANSSSKTTSTPPPKCSPTSNSVPKMKKPIRSPIKRPPISPGKLGCRGGQVVKKQMKDSPRKFPLNKAVDSEPNCRRQTALNRARNRHFKSPMKGSALPMHNNSLQNKRKLCASSGPTKGNKSRPPLPQHPAAKRRRIHFSGDKPPELQVDKKAGNSLTEELNNADTDADDYEDAVEKWVRSAPDELYYSREVDGHATATERTQGLCEKFEQTLLVKSKEAREKAEELGFEKMMELIKIENAELAEQRQLKKLKKAKKSKKCCDGHKPAVEADTEPISSHEEDVKSMEEGELVDSMDEGDKCTDEGKKTAIINEPDELKQSEIIKSKNGFSKTIDSVVERPSQPQPPLPLTNEISPPLPPMPEPPSSPPPAPPSPEKLALEQSQSPNEPNKKEEETCPKIAAKGNLGVASGCPCKSAENGEENKDKEKPKKKQKVLKKKNQKKQSKSKDNDSSDSADSSSSSSSTTTSSSDSSSDSESDEDGFSLSRSDTANRELERRKKHPRRLHIELWHNDPGLMNDGPVCRCSAKARRFGIRHGFYPGEEKIPFCDMFTNNKSKLFHYRITISPPKNFLISTPTVIFHDDHEYIFEGFSIFSHYKLDLSLPPCKVIRFNIRYDVFVEEERFPESFCVKELLLFETYLFREILELVDLKYDFNEDTGCSQFHLMPRFVRRLPDNGQEILSMSRVLIHLLKSDKELVKEEDLHKLYTVEQKEWQNFADRHKGTIVTKWGMKPCAVRVDQIDRDVSGQELEDDEGIPFPLIVHFGIRPPQLSYAGNAGYQRAWRRYVKYRHLLSNMPKPSPEDKMKLLKKEMKLQAMRTASSLKRDVTVAISSRGFRTTGICCDLVQHAMLIPVLVAHLRFHKCLQTLEKCMVYPFQNRYLLQLAMTHPSYRENFGTNPDHARNALTNCGIRQPEYGDRRIHYAYTRKRGINTLINIMAKFGADQETESDITHNERLEFLGDAVVEFVTSIHLFHIFPDLEEGGLATYRAAIVQNQHLAVLAQALNLDQYMLYAHGSDLCHDSELRHAMANCFEALMGALFLDGGIGAADRVFGNTLFGTHSVLLGMWTNYPKHPLQQEEPEGDRHWISSHDVLQKLAEFEKNIGIQFNHIRLLARAFTDRSLGYNNLTRGSNQRLEFLGDTVLQLISSEYLYRHFPDHHEGHLSLLRSSLVNNRTQSHVCDDLGMPQYAMRGDPKSEMKTKDRADLLEAFLGALYIDKGLKYCHLFCQVCFFPRLSNSITKQEWNDPKSKLQQCCLTLRAMNGKEPDIPQYKVTESLGPTNTRTYIVAVYFRGNRLATARGHSIQEAEMNAAACALEVSGHLFPQLHHQRRIMDKTKTKSVHQN